MVIERRDLNQGKGRGISTAFDPSRKLSPGSGPANAIPPSGDPKEKHGDAHVTVQGGRQTDVTESAEKRHGKPVNMRTLYLNLIEYLESTEFGDHKKFARGLAYLSGFIGAEGYHKRKLELGADLQWPEKFKFLADAGIDPVQALTDEKYLKSHLSEADRTKLWNLASYQYPDPAVDNDSAPGAHRK